MGAPYVYAGSPYADRVLETTPVTGTGTVTLTGANVLGYQTFANAFPAVDADYAQQNVYYTIWDLGPNWEVGLAVFTVAANTLTRSATNVLASSNAGGLVNFTGATAYVWCDEPAAPMCNIGMSASFSMVTFSW